MTDESTTKNQQRDAMVLISLGTFFSVMGGLLLVGTIWCWGNLRAIIVSVACGAVLILIGAGMLLGGRRLVIRANRVEANARLDEDHQ